jgi:hypothetical protein
VVSFHYPLGQTGGGYNERYNLSYWLDRRDWHYLILPRAPLTFRANLVVLGRQSPTISVQLCALQSRTSPWRPPPAAGSWASPRRGDLARLYDEPAPIFPASKLNKTQWPAFVAQSGRLGHVKRTHFISRGGRIINAMIIRLKGKRALTDGRKDELVCEFATPV